MSPLYINMWFIPSLQKLSHRQHLTESQVLQSTHTHLLDIKTDYRVAFDFSADMRPTTITIEPLIKTLRSYKLACQTPEVRLLPSFSPSTPSLLRICVHSSVSLASACVFGLHPQGCGWLMYCTHVISS